MKFHLFTGIVVSFIAVSSAQVLKRGRCPTVTVKSAFDLSQYDGVWYEFKKFPFFPERNQKCIKAQYTINDDNSVTVLNTGIDITTGEEVSITGSAKIMDEDNPAKLGVRFFRFQPYGPYWVLETDYIAYSVVWSCNDFFGIFHIESAWILSRLRIGLTSIRVNSIYGTLQGYGIDTANFQDTVQTGCT